MLRQMTATTYIVHENKILMIFHKKLRKWLPPGGHMELNETPPEAAKREAFEEVGIEIEFITQENIWIEKDNARSFERPFLCLIEEIPEYKDQPAHQHLDFVYIARPVEGSNIIHNIEESDAIAWFSEEDLHSLNEEEVFTETKETAGSVFRFLDSLVNS